MLPEGVLSIAIRADFWQPEINERKAEWNLQFTMNLQELKGKCYWLHCLQSICVETRVVKDKLSIRIGGDSVYRKKVAAN